MSAKRQQALHDHEDTLGLEGAARMLRLGLEAMKDLVDKGDVPAVRLNQKHTVMLREDLIEFLKAEGRRQAEARKRSADKRRPAANFNRPLAPRPPTRQRRVSPPDLRPYEREKE